MSRANDLERGAEYHKQSGKVSGRGACRRQGGGGRRPVLSTPLRRGSHKQLPQLPTPLFKSGVTFKAYRWCRAK